MMEILINAQWQGGADTVTLDGAKELAEMYLNGQTPVYSPVSADTAGTAVKKNGIKGFDVLKRQMQSAYDLLRKDSPDKIFTVGGGCDADVPGIVYLSEKYRGDLTVLWLDAHGDLNTPADSSSSLFYGMPLRSLMDDTCFGLLENRFPLSPSQIIHAGGRDFDKAEEEFIKKAGIAIYTVEDIRSADGLLYKAAAQIQSGHVYIHLDLDVIDPADFPDTPLPVDNGLHFGEVYGILKAFSDNLVGLGIFEYARLGAKNDYIEKLIRFGLAL